MRKIIIGFVIAMLAIISFNSAYASQSEGDWFHKFPNKNNPSFCLEHWFNSVAAAHEQGYRLEGRCPVNPTSTPTNVIPTATSTQINPTATPTEVSTEVTPTVITTATVIVTPTPISTEVTPTPIVTPSAKLNPNRNMCAREYEAMGRQIYSDEGKKSYYSLNYFGNGLIRCYWYQGHGVNERNSHGSIIRKEE